MENNKKLVGAILATGLMSFAGVLIETAMNVTFPTLIDQFTLSTSDVQWVTTIYLLVISIIVPISTYLLKRFSLRTLFLAANAFFLVGLVIDFLSPTFAILLIGRFFQGASTGIALPLMFHIILTYSPFEKRGAAIGLGNLTTSIAPAIGPTYGGLLTAHWSWNAIFLFLIPVLLISLVLGLYSIPKTAGAKDTSLDLLSVLGIVLMFSGFSLFLFGFLVCQFLLLGISFVLPNFVQLVLGKDAFTAGLVMLPGAAIGAILAPISGRLLDKVGPKKPILSGLTLIAIGWLALALVLRSPFIWSLVAGHVFYMIGIGLAYSNMMTTGLNKLTPALYADGNAIFNTLQQFSGAVATAVVATIINLAQNAATDYTQGTVIGSQIALFFLWALVLLTFLLTINYFRKSTDKKAVS